MSVCLVTHICQKPFLFQTRWLWLLVWLQALVLSQNGHVWCGDCICTGSLLQGFIDSQIHVQSTLLSMMKIGLACHVERKSPRWWVKWHVSRESRIQTHTFWWSWPRNGLVYFVAWRCQFQLRCRRPALRDRAPPFWALPSQVAPRMGLACSTSHKGRWTGTSSGRLTAVSWACPHRSMSIATLQSDLPWVAPSMPLQVLRIGNIVTLNTPIEMCKVLATVAKGDHRNLPRHWRERSKDDRWSGQQLLTLLRNVREYHDQRYETNAARATHSQWLPSGVLMNFHPTYKTIALGRVRWSYDQPDPRSNVVHLNLASPVQTTRRTFLPWAVPSSNFFSHNVGFEGL